MLTVMCPNCRYRFSAPGCCEPSNNLGQKVQHPTACYYGGLLVPRGYTSGGGCFINAPTIINGPAIIETGGQQCGSTTRIVESQFDPTRSIRVHPDGVKLIDGNPCHSAVTKIRKESQAGVVTNSFIGVPKNCDDLSRLENIGYDVQSERHITTTCDLTGGSVTITTPSIQSGGCLIQSTNLADILVQPSQIEIRPKLSVGGCLVQKAFSSLVDQESADRQLLVDEEESESFAGSKYMEDLNHMNSCCNHLNDEVQEMFLAPPSGCQELPGNGKSASLSVGEMEQATMDSMLFQSYDTANPEIHIRNSGAFDGQEEQSRQPIIGNRDFSQQQMFRARSAVPGMARKSNCCCGNVHDCSQARSRSNGVHSSSTVTDGFSKSRDSRESVLVDPTNGVQIQVNATVQLPASLGQCTLNITATTANSSGLMGPTGGRSRNNFNGGGLVQTENGSATVSVNSDVGPVNTATAANNNSNNYERRDGAPTTPVSWLMPCPWGFDTYMVDKEVARLSEVKRLLQTCGWYHEGLSWQQSENLLKDAPVGRWLMRDSSDSRYKFAVSVQTARGPTSVRVHYFLGRFRLDAEPRLIMMMPHFDCPIKMLEHYVEYSKRIDDHRREVWVDYSGQLYSQIYLTKPLVKEVRSLSHLARLVVNKNKLPTDHLPSLIQNYLAEYPYTL